MKPIVTLKLFLLALLIANNTRAQLMSTVVGGVGENYPALTHGRLFAPQQVACDAAGNVYFSDNNGTGGNTYFRKISPSGILTTIAGNSIGSSGSSGTFDFGKLARNAEISYANGIIVDHSGNQLISFAAYICKVDTAGILTVFAGNGIGGFSGDGSLASTANLSGPSGMAIDAIGNVYVADYQNNRVRKIDTFGIITTVAGGGTLLGDGGPAIAAKLNHPTSVAIDPAGNLYIADQGQNRIRKVNTSGIISTIAGTGTSIPEGDYLTLDAAGNLIYGIGARIVKLTPASTFTYIAGTGTAGFSGDGGPATAAQLNGAGSVAIDAAGNMFVVDVTNKKIRKINTAGIISTIAGNGLPKYGFGGDGGPAPLALLGYGTGSTLLSLYSLGIVTPAVAVDKAGNLFLADCANHRVRKVNAAGIITTVAGNGIAGFSGDGGPATAAELQLPIGLSFDGANNLYIADYGNHHIRKLDTFGIITTVAGGGSGGLGDGGPATAAVISTYGVFSDSVGNIYIADADSQRIRKVTAATGIITTVAGNGMPGFSGDGGLATAGMINEPLGVTVDRKGNLFIADFLNSRIRKVDTAGIISTVVGIQTYASAYSESGLGDGGPAVLARCYLPWAVTTDKYDNLYFSDRGTWVSNIYDSFKSAFHRVRRIDQFGYVTTVAGNGICGYSGDGYVAKTGEFQHPYGICLDTAGQLYVGDNTNYAIRKVCCLGNPSDHPPVFANGYLQSLMLCSGAGATAINSILTMSDPDVGDIIKWKVAAPPVHGTLGGFIYTATSTGISLTPSGLTYTPASGFAGADSFTIYITDGIDSTPTKIMVTINPLPVAGIISGLTSVCVSDSITLSTTITDGTWSASNSYASVSASGVVTGLSIGTDTLIYSITTLCGTASAVYIVQVNGLSVVGAITGPSTVCAGSSITLFDSVSGGMWSTTDPYVSVGSYSGVISGIASGSATIVYSVVNSCGTNTATYTVTVYPAPYAGTITGSTIMCVGSTDTLVNGVPGGVWSTGTPSVATVSSSGVVTGLAAGAAVIFYTVTNGCGSATALTIVNVTASTPISYITGPTMVCQGASISLNDSQPGGTWSSSDTAIATINISGVVAGVSAGVATISYTASLGCGLSVATSVVTVNSAPDAGVVTGTPGICIGDIALLTSTVSGGTWTSSNLNASISPTGIIVGLNAGVDTFIYSVTNSCGTAVAVHYTTISAASITDTISGPAALCTGASISLADATPGGVWSSSSPAVAAVNSAGIVTGVNSGIATISYSVANGCGIAIATRNIIVNVATAGTITGISTLCPGDTTMLLDAVPGGVWSAGTPSVLTINSLGIVTAVAAGSAIITYSTSGTCGAATATLLFTVGTVPFVMPVSGTSVACAGSASSFSDFTPGGTWSSSNALVATVNSSGIVTAVSAGTVVISYQVLAGCGAGTATSTLVVQSPLAVAVISGTSAVCTGASLTLAASISGGTWSSSNSSIATVNAAGQVTGIAAGTVIISYSLTNSCGTVTATHSIVVSAATAGTITGITSLCPGGVSTLSATVAGGAWSVSTPTVATINSAGVVTAIAAGTAVVTYSTTGICGTALATATISIGTLPVIAPIVGASTICVGSVSSLSCATLGGVWSSSNPTVATVNAAGVVSGLSAGTCTITYMVTAGCGATGSILTMHIESAPSAGVITGSASLCAGSSTTFSASVPGGIWSSSNTAIVSIASSGMATGAATGSATIIYSVSNSCGMASALFPVSVSSLPAVGAISGNLNICEGNTTMLIDTAGGGVGVWTSNSPTVASASSSGIATGIVAGAAVISYTLVNACGSASATAMLTVNPVPYITAITGVPLVNVGGTTVLYNAVLGGVWSGSDATVATIDAAGTVYGVSTGVVMMTYTLTNGYGCTADTTIAVVVSNAVGIDKVAATGGYILYPNPAVNAINITWDALSETPSCVIVTDVAGREVLRSVHDNAGSSGTMVLSLQDVSEGTYTLTIISNAGVRYSKLFTVR